MHASWHTKRASRHQASRRKHESASWSSNGWIQQGATHHLSRPSSSEARAKQRLLPPHCSAGPVEEQLVPDCTKLDATHQPLGNSALDLHTHVKPACTNCLLSVSARAVGGQNCSSSHRKTKTAVLIPLDSSAAPVGQQCRSRWESHKISWQSTTGVQPANNAPKAV